MLISRNWLQTFFPTPLPGVEALSDALMFHAFEVDSVDPVRFSEKYTEGKIDFVLDVKVTPNRGHDCLCHFGIAQELSAILRLPLHNDPLSHPKVTLEPKTDAVSVSIHRAALCKRYIAGYIKGVKVGPSPEWLRVSLEALGQRSINNVVDATNYIMFNLGQPLHAFDASQLVLQGSTLKVGVRYAKEGEKIVALDGTEYTLDTSMLVVVDDNKGLDGEVIGIAGVKGGMPAGISETTTDIVLESAHFDGVSVRKTAQALKLRTDASSRFEQQISPERASYGMRAVANLILEIAGGELQGFCDVYPLPQEVVTVSVTASHVANVLGDTFGEKEIIDSFDRLGFSYTKKEEIFTVTVPFDRLDLTIPEDLIEEVGRIQGYERVPPLQLPAFSKTPEVNPHFYAAEKIREEFVSEGYSEVYTSVFADTGERVVRNKVDGTKPYLRGSLLDGLTEALKKNIPNKESLGLTEVKLFEIGTVWMDDAERVVVGTISEKQNAEEKPLIAVEAVEYDDLLPSQTERYHTFSRYPYIVRDVSLWVPEGVFQDLARRIIIESAGSLLVNEPRLTDTFTPKDGKISNSYRLIFQSFEKTLTDEEVNSAMEKVYTSLREKGFEIR